MVKNRQPRSIPCTPPVDVTFGWVFSRPERIIAFGFGSGLIHPGPGTWGTLLGWLIWVAGLDRVPGPWLPVLLLVFFWVGCWAAQRCSDALGVPDHGGINWDEMVAIWFALWLVPQHWGAQLVVVIFFRLFDIVKPPPVNVLDRRFKNGFGVMIDDIVAALYALLATFALIRLGGWT